MARRGGSVAREGHEEAGVEMAALSQPVLSGVEGSGGAKLCGSPKSSSSQLPVRSMAGFRISLLIPALSSAYVDQAGTFR